MEITEVRVTKGVCRYALPWWKFWKRKGWWKAPYYRFREKVLKQGHTNDGWKRWSG